MICSNVLLSSLREDLEAIGGSLLQRLTYMTLPRALLVGARECGSLGLDCSKLSFLLDICTRSAGECSNLVDPASSHMLVLKIKPCMSKYK